MDFNFPTQPNILTRRNEHYLYFVMRFIQVEIEADRKALQIEESLRAKNAFVFEEVHFNNQVCFVFGFLHLGLSKTWLELGVRCS